MNFNEILERYKSNTATEEEKQFIQDEIEKYKLLTDYIAEKEYTALDDTAFIKAAAEMKSIKKSLKKRSAKIVLTAIAVISFFALLINFIAIPIINKLYYDPAIQSYSDFASDFEVSLSAFTELFFPGYISNNVYIEKTGIGKYSLQIMQTNRFNWDTSIYPATIDKDTLNLPHDFFKYSICNIFAFGAYPFDYRGKDDFNEAKNYISTLPDYLKMQVYISFNRDLTMDEIVAMRKKYTADIIWVGIRNSLRDEQLYPLIGLVPTDAGSIYEKINEKYPYFELWDALDEEWDASGEALASHFKTMLKYQIEHKEFYPALKPVIYSANEYYTRVADYIEENGVQSYGVVAMGSAQDILNLCKEEYVCQLDIDDIIVNTSFN